MLEQNWKDPVITLPTVAGGRDWGRLINTNLPGGRRRFRGRRFRSRTSTG
jgi:hypothetical protein